MWIKALAAICIFGTSVSIFSPSDIDFINSQNNCQVALKQAKIDCDQRIRDYEDRISGDRSSWTTNINSVQTNYNNAQTNFAQLQMQVESFLAKFTGLLQGAGSYSNFLNQSVDGNGRITDLMAAFDILKSVIGAPAAVTRDTNCQADLQACMMNLSQQKSSFNDLNIQVTRIQGQLSDCQNNMSSSQSSSVTTIRSNYESQLQTCNSNLEDARSTASTLSTNIASMNDRLRAAEVRATECARNGGNASQTNAQIATLRAEWELRLQNCNNQFKNAQTALDSCNIQINNSKTQIRIAETRASECARQISQSATSAGQITSIRSSYESTINQLRIDLAACRTAMTTSTTELNTCRSNSISMSTSTNTNANDIKSLRSKLQFLYDMSSYCRQNFYDLVNDKNAINNAYKDLLSFTINLKPVRDIRGDLQTKFETVANERNSFQKKVELLGLLLRTFNSKVDGYNVKLKEDGFDTLTTSGNNVANVGTWQFSSSIDGVDVNDLSDVNKCRAAVNVIRQKLSTVTTNLNTAIRNSNDCVKKFGESTAMMIGSSTKEDY